jgi:hypothetical protein
MSTRLSSNCSETVGSHIFFSDFFVTCPSVSRAIALRTQGIGVVPELTLNQKILLSYSDRLGRCGFAKPQQQMILLLGYFVSLTATFVMSVAVLSVVLAATRANEATLYHLHRSDTVQLSKHGNKEFLGKSRLVTAKGPSKTKASWSVVER